MTELGSHFQAGRLDSAEFAERLDAAAAARYRDDLGRLLADLPRAVPPAPARPSRHWPQVRAAAALAVIPVLTLVMLTAFGLTTRHGHGHWGALWWLVPAFVFLFRRLWRGQGARR